MPVLRLEHAIRDFDLWKSAFDRDPIGRERSGVRGHRVFRPIDDPNYIAVDLEFDTVAELIVEVLRNTQPLAAKDGSPSKVKYATSDGVADKTKSAAAELLDNYPLYPGLTLS